MTPLPWWVLLATLLGRAIGVPVHGVDDACVPLCRERYDVDVDVDVDAARPVELCNANELVLQYDGRHDGGHVGVGVGARSALGLCLAPCAAAPDELRARGYLEDLQICRALRAIVAEIEGCDCGSVGNLPYESVRAGGPRNPARSHGTSLNQYRDVVQSADEELRQFLRELKEEDGQVEAEAEAEAEVGGSSKSSLDQPALGTMDGVVRGKPSKYWIRRLAHGKGSKVVWGLGVTTTEASSSEEEPVDWDMWCMAQCDNGQGGTACKCDIIP